MKIAPEQFNELVRNRRSVFPRQFDTGRRVDDGIVEQVLTNATWAPNHGQTEPWYFKVFTKEGLNRFAALQTSLYKAEYGEGDPAKIIKLEQQPLLASHIISIGMKRSDKKQIAEIEEIEAVACAVQNMYLTIAAYGVGGYWTTGGVTYLEKAKFHFGLGEPDKLLGFFYIGHVAVPSPGAKRKPIEEKVEWVTA